jgi:hypothetical protein
MLVIADRGFYSYRLWQAAAASGGQGLLQSRPSGTTSFLDRFG